MSRGMKYDFENMRLVIDDVGKQLKAFTDTLDKFREELTKLSAGWEGGASGAANSLGSKLETQGREISGTVKGFFDAMQRNLASATDTEKQATNLFTIA